MERGDRSNLELRFVNLRSSSGVVFQEARNNNTNNNGNNNNDNNAMLAKRPEDHQYIPIANINRIVRRILPSEAKIADDAKEIIQECVSEFISFITSESNERTQHEKRKTVNTEDILSAMDKLGFDNYVELLTIFLNKYCERESERTCVRGEPFVTKTVDFAPRAPPVAQPAPRVDPTPISMLPPMDYALGVAVERNQVAAMDGYYRNKPDDDHASSSHSNVPYDFFGFDPFMHFK